MGWVDWPTLSIALAKNGFSRLRTEESTVVGAFQKDAQKVLNPLHFFDPIDQAVIGRTAKIDP